MHRFDAIFVVEAGCARGKAGRACESGPGAETLCGKVDDGAEAEQTLQYKVPGGPRGKAGWSR